MPTPLPIVQLKIESVKWNFDEHSMCLYGSDQPSYVCVTDFGKRLATSKITESDLNYCETFASVAQIIVFLCYVKVYW